VETKFCKHCQCEHTLTGEFWYFTRETRCKIREKSLYLVRREKILSQKSGYYIKNKQTINQKDKDYRTSNGEKINQRRRYRYQNDTQFKMQMRLRGRLVDAISSSQKAGSFVRDLGCPVHELKHYLESKFQEGMTWDNWGLYGWHIDHIIPLSSFDLTDRAQFLKACHYTNLQTLWAEDNLKKSDKVTEL